MFATNTQQQKSLKLLTIAFPDNDALQEEVGTLIETKELNGRRGLRKCGMEEEDLCTHSGWSGTPSLNMDVSLTKLTKKSVDSFLSL